MTMNPVSNRILAWIGLLLFACVAGAHSPDEKAVAYHGGMASTTAGFNLELLVLEGRLRLYVRDRKNRLLSVKGGHAKALAWGEQATEQVELRPGADNALEGTYEAASLRRVVITLAMPGREPATVWFSEIGRPVQ